MWSLVAVALLAQRELLHRPGLNMDGGISMDSHGSVASTAWQTWESRSHSPAWQAGRQSPTHSTQSNRPVNWTGDGLPVNLCMQLSAVCGHLLQPTSLLLSMEVACGQARQDTAACHSSVSGTAALATRFIRSRSCIPHTSWLLLAVVGFPAAWKPWDYVRAHKAVGCCGSCARAVACIPRHINSS